MGDEIGDATANWQIPLARVRNHVVASLLALRAWSIAILSRAPCSIATIAGIREPVWRLFLSLERCAIPLLERMSPDDLDQLDEGVRSVIRDFAARDMQTVMEARHVAAAIDVISQELGVPIASAHGTTRITTRTAIS